MYSQLNKRPLCQLSRKVTGFAGTGKSFVLKHLIKTLSNEGLYATSSTGISAIPLGGMTLHSFAGIGIQTALHLTMY